jgi:hypothetical protein
MALMQPVYRAIHAAVIVLGRWLGNAMKRMGFD